jgi:hypothetical protein
MFRKMRYVGVHPCSWGVCVCGGRVVGCCVVKPTAVADTIGWWLGWAALPSYRPG